MDDLYIETINYDEKSLNAFENKMRGLNLDDQFPITFPSVYIGIAEKENLVTHMMDRQAYVGETNWILQRTREHLNGKSKDKLNQLQSKGKTKLHIIADRKFNKSATLLVEQTFMSYLLGDPIFTGIQRDASDEALGTINGRTNDQPNFFNRAYYERELFPEIWTQLHLRNIVSDLDLVQNSPLFANSPFKSLSEQQEYDKQMIHDQIAKALKTKPLDRPTKLIKVVGSAGTGKTILLASLFQDLFDHPYVIKDSGNTERSSSVAMLVRHEQQLRAYKEIAAKTNMNAKGNVVFDVPRFISKNKPFDIVLVDEAHLLWTGNYGRVNSSKWKPDLKGIMDLARVVVLVYDPKQRVSSRGYLPETLMKEINEAEPIELTEQWRIRANQDTQNWINKFSNFEKIQ